ncbi:MAG: pilus assembly protein [Clostridiales bacterium]|jgi:Flp pilus assembly protein TadG|nr:pilus assembly protein [Clostridiales bacterium]
MRRENEKGQAMVEFALVLPILILLVCGIIDFGWIYSNQITVTNACREAARYSSVHLMDNDGGDISGVEDDARALVSQFAPMLESPTVTFEDPDNTSITSDSDTVKVTVSAQVPVLTGITSTFLGGNEVKVSAESTMKIEK